MKPKSILLIVHLIVIVIGFVSCVLVKGSQDRNFQMGLIFWPSEDVSNNRLIRQGVDYTISGSEILTVQVGWHPLDTSFLSKIAWIAGLSRNHRQSLTLNIDWMSMSRNGVLQNNWSFKDSTSRDAFIRTSFAACAKYRPEYILLGVEVNYYALTDPTDFAEFIDVYNFTKKLINDSFPEIKVTASFQLELLFGADRRWGDSETLEAFEAFGDNFDIIAISTYPHLRSNNLVNSDLISNLSILSNRPIGIFETAVPTDVYSETLQANYLQDIIDYSRQSQQIKLLIWTSSIDPTVQDTLDQWSYHLGLIDRTGRPKKAWSIWRKTIKENASKN